MKSYLFGDYSFVFALNERLRPSSPEEAGAEQFGEGFPTWKITRTPGCDFPQTGENYFSGAEQYGDTFRPGAGGADCGDRIL